MNLEHSFTVPVGVDEAWRILLDINLIGPCMPGAAIESVDGDDFTGSVKVKLGPIGLTYKGKASFVEKDEATHRAVIDARGRDARGNGTAAAKVTATLTDHGARTLVEVATDLDITGKPAQFGRGVMVDVGNKLIGQFADNLAATIGADSTASAPAATPDASDDTAAAQAPAAKPAARPATKSAAKSAAKAPATKAAPRKRTAKATKATATSDAATSDTAPAASDPPHSTAASGGEAASSAGAPISESAVEASGQGPASYAAPSAAPVNGTAPGSGQPAARPASPPQREVEPINLIESAGPAVAKRLVPLVVALLVAILVVRKLRR